MLQRKSFWLLCFTGLVLLGMTDGAFAQRWNPSHSVGTVSGKYYYQYNQTPDQLVEIYPALISTGTVTYQWQSSGTLREEDFQPVANGGNTSFSPGPLLQTTYYRRKTTYTPTGAFVFSNTIKLSVVSSNWEDRNYIREHDVQVTGITTWQVIDQMPVGQKLQTTTYLDGLGRGVESVDRETATPAQAGGLWGDVIKFNKYDELGRETRKYLPYTTTTESGKFKTDPGTEQPLYYTSVYNETSAFSTISYDNSPLNKVTNIKSPGTSWAAGAGSSAVYEMNGVDDHVQVWGLDYVKGNPPVKRGEYNAGALFKTTVIDVKGKQVVEYKDKSGQLILKKLQIDDAPSGAHTGWICTYYVYDDLGFLRYQLQPEAVRYLDTHNWSFTGTDGSQVLNELCYQYYYDDKGRMTWKKAPGAAPLNMLYDIRDRLVFTQDGNQATLSTPQWMANLYDELDRLVISTLYNTSKTIATLQTEINNASGSGTHPISVADLGNPGVATILNYHFYDDYSFASVKAFNTNFTNLLAYSTSDPNIMPIVASKRTLNLQTGSLTRVLGTTTFLAATQYYDEEEQECQLLEDNMKGGTDITTQQYHFDSRVVSSCLDHTAPGTGYTNFITLTKYDFDKLGRVTAIEKQYGSNPFKTVSTFDYDDVGRIKTKHLDPAYTAGGNNELESLQYSFNIHNKITGINKDYALKNPSVYDKWQHFFGLFLGYDNRDNIFTSGQLTGQITGAMWNTQGDDAQRKYEYTYDNAGRLCSAVFNEQKHPGEGWSSNKMDFSVTGTSGKITYDLNSNLLNMLHKGVAPGQAAPITIDELTYSYVLSNKLLSVTDQMTATSVNGKFGDFKDGSNGAQPDYVYDNNGNLVIDLNKDIKELGVNNPHGITYNFLDKPEQIRIAGKGTINIVYSASGEKLKRTFTPESGTPTTITYINQFVYEASDGNADALSFINFEEGRIRVIQPTAQDNGYDLVAIAGNITLPGGKAGVYDYFIKDYLDNVRMVLTEETHNAANTCTMETGRATIEDAIFGQTGGANEVEVTRYAAPASWDYPEKGSSVSRLGNLAGHNIGPNSLQKVMAGDKVTTSVQYYYLNATGGSNPDFVTTLLTSLGQAITGSPIAGNLVKSNVPGITSGLNGTSGFINAVQPSGTGGTTPKAFLTVLFFDERFNFIEAADGGVWQQQVAASVGSGGLPLGFGNIKAPKNGYVYVYVNNQSDQDVYFDNLKVGIARGNIIEENHYYAYGLKIAAISSRKPGDINEGKLKNDYLYNDKELFEEADLDWYDFGFRNYDPQIGRFVQIDPLTDDYPILSTYLFANADPINEIDVDGLFGGIGTTAATAQELATVYVVFKKVAATTAGATARITVNATGMAIKGAVAASSAVNNSVDTKPAGGGGFWSGFKSGFVGVFKGIGQAVSHPIETLKSQFTIENLRDKALNLSTGGMYGAVKQSVEAVDKVITKGSTGAGEVLGEIAADVVVTLATEGAGKAAGALGKAARETKLLGKAKPKVKIPCGCFIAGTLILTERGLVQIQDIRVGDKVWAYNDTTGTYDLKRVKQLFSYTRDTVYAVMIGNEVINTTSDHPFFVFGKWVRVFDLKVGDSLQTYTGQKLAINSIQLIPGGKTVYNFEVEDFHTYFVSDQKVLVHNAGPCNAATRTENGLKTGKAISEKKAIEMIRQGKDVIVGSRKQAIKLAKKAFKGKPMKHDGHLLRNGKIGEKHVHPKQHINTSHVFYK
jgi:RHS repeat-associated protein